MEYLFSIVTPVYNRIDSIKEMVNSLTVQCFENYELIIVDNGSTDGTFEYCQSIINEKIKVYRCLEKGVSYARNTGIRVALGEWVIILDSDNIFAERNALGKIKDVILDFPDANVILTSNISDKGEIISFSKKLDNYLNLEEYLHSSGEFSAIAKTAWYKNNLHPEIPGVIHESSLFVFIKAAIERKLVLSSLIAQIYGTQSNNRICSSDLPKNRAWELFIYYKILLEEYGDMVRKQKLKAYFVWSLKLLAYGKISKELNILYYIKSKSSLLLLPFFLIPTSVIKKMIEKLKQTRS